jgi:tetratricopeptide (TPR) repeat protein
MRSFTMATLVAALTLAGCATAPPQTQAPVVTLPSGEAPAELPAPERPDPSVSVALRTRSAEALGAGDVDGAIALLERALRIEPRRAELWLDLARIHLFREDPERALQFARKGLQLAAGNEPLTREARALLTQIEAAIPPA